MRTFQGQPLPYELKDFVGTRDQLKAALAFHNALKARKTQETDKREAKTADRLAQLLKNYTTPFPHLSLSLTDEGVRYAFTWFKDDNEASVEGLLPAASYTRLPLHPFTLEPGRYFANRIPFYVSDRLGFFPGASLTPESDVMRGLVWMFCTQLEHEPDWRMELTVSRELGQLIDFQPTAVLTEAKGDRSLKIVSVSVVG